MTQQIATTSGSHTNRFAKRLERLAVALLAKKFSEWQRKAAFIVARLDHEERKGSPAKLLPEIEATIVRIESELAEWRQTLTLDDHSGQVADAERASALILKTLVDARERAYRSSNCTRQ